jgi:hypothetical protein
MKFIQTLKKTLLLKKKHNYENSESFENITPIIVLYTQHSAEVDIKANLILAVCLSIYRSLRNTVIGSRIFRHLQLRETS